MLSVCGFCIHFPSKLLASTGLAFNLLPPKRCGVTASMWRPRLPNPHLLTTAMQYPHYTPPSLLSKGLFGKWAFQIDAIQIDVKHRTLIERDDNAIILASGLTPSNVAELERKRKHLTVVVRFDFRL